MKERSMRTFSKGILAVSQSLAQTRSLQVHVAFVKHGIHERSDRCTVFESLERALVASGAERREA